jgi:N-acetylglucosaminyl-diphospho-decaprenol L-rhamnosyltransferase
MTDLVTLCDEAGDCMLDVSVIMVSYNTVDMTRKALDHLLASTPDVKMDVLIVDNNSKDHSAEILRREYPDIKLFENSKNVGFGRANNQVLPYIDSRYVLLLNTDAFVQPDTVLKTVKFMDAHPRTGVLGVKLFGGDGELQPCCRYFPTPWNIFVVRMGLERVFKNARLVDNMSWDHASVRDCDWVPGCYYLIRREVIDEIGLFDRRYFLYYEEVDHCFAVKAAGWDVTYFPYTSVIHLGGESAKSEGEITVSGRQLESLRMESELLYFRKNHGLMFTVLDLFLVTLADFIQILKDIVKLRPKRRHWEHLNHIVAIWVLSFKTRMGSQATR